MLCMYTSLHTFQIFFMSFFFFDGLASLFYFLFWPYLAVSMYNVSSNSSAILKQHVDKVKYSKLFDKQVLTYSHDNNMYCDLSITWLIIIHVSTCTYRDVNLEWFRLIIFILQPKKIFLLRTDFILDTSPSSTYTNY